MLASSMKHVSTEESLFNAPHYCTFQEQNYGGCYGSGIPRIRNS